VKSFADIFGGGPTVTAAARGRVNLLGEHTDYNEGYVLPTAIPQQTRVALRVRNNTPFEVYSANLDQRAQFTLERPPALHFAQYIYGCISEAVKHGARIPPLQIHIDSDVPLEVGLSSSAALEVATLRALRELLDLKLDDVQIAKLAQMAEIEYAGVNCGILDQMASSLLDTGSMLFLDTRSLDRELLPLPEHSEVLVIDSGVARSLASSKYNERRAECEEAARQLGLHALRDVSEIEAVDSLSEPLRNRARHIVSENARVLRAAAGASAAEFGRLMNASHQSLRDDYEVSIPPLDQLVAFLQSEPAVHGAKLTGAGFGGACVALCKAGVAVSTATKVLTKYRNAGHEGRLLVPMAA
jgi:galactokinase